MSATRIACLMSLAAFNCLNGLEPSLAAEAQSIDLRSGENVELGTLFWIANCKSLLKSTPTAEIMEGPPELAVTIRAQAVTPYKDNCAKAVPGGILILTATKDIKTHLQGKLFFRVKYQTKDGDRQSAREVDYNLFP